MKQNYSLHQLGWQTYFQQQLSLDEFESAHIARVIAHHRNEYIAQSEQYELKINITPSLPSMTVGDWILIDDQHRFIRLLERKSELSRKAAGTQLKAQLIAANIDTLFIVSSFNQDFNLNRIERYLAIAHEAEIEPVIVLTKPDLCGTNTAEYIEQLHALDAYLMLETVNSLDVQSVSALLSWCGKGKTVSFMGSSGVGKSTLVNSLMSSEQLLEGEITSSLQLTGSIREDDSKGRHTTTSRSIHFMPSGAVLIDTPGMRELQLTACESGVSQTFSDVEALISQCRFNDCQHQSEPNCAITEAIHNGALEQRRFDNYIKLMREQARNNASLMERRASDKALSKMYRKVIGENQQVKKGY